MSNFKKDIENFYQDAFNNYELKPSDKVWGNIEKELMKKSFFKFNPKKINIYYTVIIVLLTVGLSSAFLLNKKTDTKFSAQIFDVTSVINNSRNTISENQIQASNDKVIASNHTIFKEEVVEKNNLISTNSEIFTTEIEQVNNDLLQKSEINNTKIIFGISDAVNVNITNEKADTISKFAEQKNVKFGLSDCKGCAPFKVVFDSKIQNIGLAKWDFGDGNISTEINPEHIYNTHGKYVVCVEYLVNGEKSKFFDTVYVNETPVAKFDVSNSNLQKKEIVEFVNYSQNATIYNWDFGDNTINTEFEPEHSYIQAGKFTIKLKVTNSANCSDSSSKELEIKEEKYQIVFPTAFTPNISGSNGGTYSLTNVNNDVFYPVIAKGVEEYNLTIYNRKGIIIFTTDDIKIGWDGYFNNQLVSPEVYVYAVKGKYFNGEEFLVTGNVTLFY